jgi:hypothetical protein
MPTMTTLDLLAEQPFLDGRTDARGGFDGPGVRRLIADDAELGRELTTRFMAVVVDRLQATRVRLLESYGYPAVD